MKHRLLTFSIVVALFFALAIPAFAASKTLGVSEIDQNKTEWCWAACSEMIGKYYDSGSNRDQYDLVEYIKGNTRFHAEFIVIPPNDYKVFWEGVIRSTPSNMGG